MNPHEIFRDKLLRADNIDPSAVAETEIARFRQLPNAPKSVAWQGRQILRTPVMRLTAAAVVLVAALLGVRFFHTTARPTWATVLEKVNSFDTCVYRSREVETTGPRPDGFEFATESESRNYRSETRGTFSENYKKGE